MAKLKRDFQQVEWDAQTIDDCRQLVRLAVREDLQRGHDITTVALVPHEARGAAMVTSRTSGVVAGLSAAGVALDEMQIHADWRELAVDGERFDVHQGLAHIEGFTRDLLTAERILLNLIGRLSGIATKTRLFVDAVAGTEARIYDTRKTTPGWRRLEKYAVRMGGGTNHRTGLFDAVLIKDNHLAQAGGSPYEAVERARRFLDESPVAVDSTVLIEIEVDTLEQLRQVLPSRPDIVLLDNMTYDELSEATRIRDSEFPTVELEASGGISLETVRRVAECGVDRISVGALTHSATSLDVGLDWDPSKDDRFEARSTTH